MKITIYIGGLTGGGAERVCCNLASFLVQNRHEVTMLTVSKPNEMCYSLDPQVKLETLETQMRVKNNSIRAIVKQIRLFSFVRKHKTDAYVVMLPKTIQSLMLFRRFIKAPIIVSERANPDSYSQKTQNFLKRAAGYADGFVFQTKDAKEWYDPYIKHYATIIPNAINPDFIRPVYTGAREKSIVSAGRLSEQKNFKLLLEAFAAVAPEYPEYTLKIFGKGPLEEALKVYAQTLGVADRTQFMGYVSNMPEQLEKASVFVLSSDFEGMPNALMEAMALGLPCISTDCPAGGPRFLIQHGKNGLLVPVGDREVLIAALKKLLGNDPVAAQMGKTARNVADKLSPERIYGLWEKFLTEVVGSK